MVLYRCVYSKNLLERDLNLWPPDWRAGALPTVLTNPTCVLAVSLFCQYLCSSKMYLKMYPVSFPCGSLHDTCIYTKKVISPYSASPYSASPYCLFPGCIVTWAWSLAKGQYMVEWLLTVSTEQRYWQNTEIGNIGLVSSVGRSQVQIPLK